MARADTVPLAGMCPYLLSRGIPGVARDTPVRLGRVLGYIMSGRHYLSLEEFCAHTSLSEATVRRLCRKGKIPFRQPGGPRTKLLFDPSALEQVGAGSRAQPQQPVLDPVPAIPGPAPRWRKKVGQGRN